MKKFILFTLCFLVNLMLIPRLQAQNATQTEITFTQEKKEQAREQLRRIFSEYDLDPWIITQEVKIEAEVDPHSRPILTMNTKHLDNDKVQMSIFIHEQAHWLPWQKRKPAREELAKMYPEIDGMPNVEDASGERKERLIDFQERVYNHIIVAWVEFDAMVELVGETEAREVFKQKIDRVVEEPYSNLDKTYIWYNNKVLEEPNRIGEVLAKHGLIITPNNGLIMDSAE